MKFDEVRKVEMVKYVICSQIWKWWPSVQHLNGFVNPTHLKQSKEEISICVI